MRFIEQLLRQILKKKDTPHEDLAISLEIRQPQTPDGLCIYAATCGSWIREHHFDYGVYKYRTNIT